jgi:hypothetical protein
MGPAYHLMQSGCRDLPARPPDRSQQRRTERGETLDVPVRLEGTNLEVPLRCLIDIRSTGRAPEPNLLRAALMEAHLNRHPGPGPLTRRVMSLADHCSPIRPERQAAFSYSRSSPMQAMLKIPAFFRPGMCGHVPGCDQALEFYVEFKQGGAAALEISCLVHDESG